MELGFRYTQATLLFAERTIRSSSGSEFKRPTLMWEGGKGKDLLVNSSAGRPPDPDWKKNLTADGLSVITDMSSNESPFSLPVDRSVG